MTVYLEQYWIPYLLPSLTREVPNSYYYSVLIPFGCIQSLFKNMI
jgi:hypothetical protein